jgi:hypothetical protein
MPDPLANYYYTVTMLYVLLGRVCTTYEIVLSNLMNFYLSFKSGLETQTCQCNNPPTRSRPILVLSEFSNFKFRLQVTVTTTTTTFKLVQVQVGMDH